MTNSDKLCEISHMLLNMSLDINRLECENVRLKDVNDLLYEKHEDAQNGATKHFITDVMGEYQNGVQNHSCPSCQINSCQENTILYDFENESKIPYPPDESDCVNSYQETMDFYDLNSGNKEPEPQCRHCNVKNDQRKLSACPSDSTNSNLHLRRCERFTADKAPSKAKEKIIGADEQTNEVCKYENDRLDKSKDNSNYANVETWITGLCDKHNPKDESESLLGDRQNKVDLCNKLLDDLKAVLLSGTKPCNQQMHSQLLKDTEKDLQNVSRISNENYLYYRGMVSESPSLEGIPRNVLNDIRMKFNSSLDSTPRLDFSESDQLLPANSTELATSDGNERSCRDINEKLSHLLKEMRAVRLEMSLTDPNGNIG